MKDITYLLVGLLMVILNACSGIEEPTLQICTDFHEEEIELRSIQEATQIANSVISQSQNHLNSRAATTCPVVSYVLRTEKTRSVSSNDTIGYLFNYPEEKGFVLIAASPQIEPLIAFSEEGNLDLSDQFVFDHIVSPFEYYVNNESNNTRGSDLPGITPGIGLEYEIVEIQEPKILIYIDQNSPWNSKVEEMKGPGYVTGCVQTAGAYIVSHCNNNFILRGTSYDFSEIVKSIANKQGETSLGSTNYPYSTAVAKMSQLLWDLGQEFGAEYNAKFDSITNTTRYSTSGISRLLASKLQEWGYASPTNGLVSTTITYNPNTIITYLRDGSLIYMEGWGKNDNNQREGHAWIADGYKKMRPKSTKPGLILGPTETYLHFKWGWRTKFDGYYSGMVYNPKGIEYSITQYAAFTILNN